MIGAQQKIIIVDDDPIWLEIAQFALSEAGYNDVQKYDNLEQQHAEIETGLGTTDLVVTDLNMPGWDGIQFLRQISEADFKGRVIVCSGENELLLDASRRQAAELGLNIVDALSKPVSGRLLVDKVKQGLTPRTQNKPKYSARFDFTELFNSGQIVGFYQPQIHVRTGRLSFEILARLQSPKWGVRGPAEFLPPLFAQGHGPLLFSSLLESAVGKLRFPHQKG